MLYGNFSWYIIHIWKGYFPHPGPSGPPPQPQNSRKYPSKRPIFIMISNSESDVMQPQIPTPATYYFIIISHLVIVGTSGSGLFDAGVGARHPASGGQFWPPEKNRKWPEVGIRIFYHFFKKHVQFHIICVLKPLETIFSLATAMINNIFLWKRFKSKFKTY